MEVFKFERYGKYMITTLNIKNIGIIEELCIDLNKGLNVLTGETGAGKTLIIDSLQIISGGRFSKEMIRKGETNSFVEICMFDENLEGDEKNIIVSREINVNGKNMCKINGRMVTVNELKEFMMQYIEIHGQNDNQKILDSKEHLKYLDNFIGSEMKKCQKEYAEIYEQYLLDKKELKQNYGDEKERQRKLDLLTYQINEIDEVDLKKGEDEELEGRRKIILNSEKISENLNEADSLIGENGINSISMAIRALEKIEVIDDKYKEVSSNLKNAYYELQEVSRDISGYKDDIYFDEEERNFIEERLDLIKSLKRKYGNTIEEIVKYKEETKKEVEYIKNLEENNSNLRHRIETAEVKMEIVTQKMSKIRAEESRKLSDKINCELSELEMISAKINIRVEKMDVFTKDGKDRVEIYISTNRGEDEKELVKIASGGELSRVMLAIKKVLTLSDKTPVLIFDEIDTGISGSAANSVAKKLKIISKSHQVMVISHLPNIAAAGDYNYFISKSTNEVRTKTSIKQLDDEEVLEEIARISSGEITKGTLKYAFDLREKLKV